MKSDIAKVQLLECQVKGTTYYINVASIIYVESRGHHLHIMTVNAEYVIRNTLKNFYQALPQTIFHRVHQSYLFNLNYLIAFSPQEINLQGNYQIPIGRKYRQAFVEKMSKLVK